MNTMTNNKWLLRLILILLMINIAFTVFLWTRQKHPPRPKFPDQKGMPPREEFLIHFLDLDSKQQIQFRNISRAHFKRMDSLKEQEYQTKIKLFDLLEQDTVSTKTIESLSAEVSAVQHKIDLEQFFHLQKIRAICSAQQREKLKEVVQGAIMKDIGPAKFPAKQHWDDSMRKIRPPMPPDDRPDDRPDGPHRRRDGEMPPPPDEDH